MKKFLLVCYCLMWVGYLYNLIRGVHTDVIFYSTLVMGLLTIPVVIGFVKSRKK